MIAWGGNKTPDVTATKSREGTSASPWRRPCVHECPGP